MKEWIRRTALGAGVPFVIVAVGLGPFLAYRADLGDRVATHYGISGRADGSMTVDQLLMVILAMMAIGLGACVVIAVSRRKMQPMSAPSVAFVGAFIGALSAGILATTAIGQRGLERWQDATLDPWTVVVWLVGSVTVGSFAAWIAASLPFHRDVGADTEPPTMDLAAGERAFWSSTLSAKWPLSASLAVLMLTLVLTQLAAPWIVMCGLLTALVVAAFSRIRVTVDHSGLRVRYGFFGWPHTSIPIRRIATAHAIEVRPADWGGWGYRGSLTLLKRAAVVLRAGPGIRVDLHDGRVFAVTIDNPESPALLLNAEVSRLTASETLPAGMEEHR